MTNMMNKIASLGCCGVKYANKVPNCLIALFARISMAAIFWRSAMTKITLNEEVSNFSLSQLWNVITFNWTVGDSTYMLFEYEYDLPILSPEFAANMSVAAEILLPLSLLVGLATRLSAAGMLGMTLVIQIFVLPGSWPDHALWATALLFLVTRGAGVASLDYFIVRKYCP